MASRIPLSRLSLVIFCVWTAIGLATTQITFVALTRSGTAVDWRALLADNVFSVWLWALFTPAIIWLTHKEPFWTSPRSRQVVVHLAACAGFAIADVLIERAASLVIPLTDVRSGDVLTVFLRRLFLNSLCYVAVVAIATVMGYARITRERVIAQERLAGQLVTARLHVLEAQLRPHFLFNTLSMIAEMIHVDAEKADYMIGRLGHLLRVSLKTSTSHEVTLAEELEALDCYLDIMNVRLSGRARFAIDVDQDLLDALVPSFLLQPLAENSCRHGIETTSRDTLIQVTARRIGTALRLQVIDDGQGFDPATLREGIGLSVIRERLKALYGEQGSLRLSRGNEAHGGTAVTVTLPLRHFKPTTPSVGSIPERVPVGV